MRVTTIKIFPKYSFIIDFFTNLLEILGIQGNDKKSQCKKALA